MKKMEVRQDLILRKSQQSNRRQWSEESMIGAMKAVAEGTSITGAAREHGVPRTTLQDRILGKVTHGTKPGPKRYLNEVEEKKLLEFLVETAVLGYGRSRGEIIAIVEGTTKKKGTLRKNKISHGWFDSFMKRLPYLSLRKGDATGHDRMMLSHQQLSNIILTY